MNRTDKICGKIEKLTVEVRKLPTVSATPRLKPEHAPATLAEIKKMFSEVVHDHISKPIAAPKPETTSKKLTALREKQSRLEKELSEEKGKTLAADVLVSTESIYYNYDDVLLLKFKFYIITVT